jgi:MFS family permease
MARIAEPRLQKTLVGNGNLGSCIGAHNTAVYWALHSLGGSTVLISLMTTVSALPYTLFTLPAGAIADMVDRKKILLAVQLWHASIAIALAILWTAHLLNPYLILVSAFLFSAGFAFGSPAHSSVIAEMVSAEELGSAYTLAGMQMDLCVLSGCGARWHGMDTVSFRTLGSKSTRHA